MEILTYPFTGNQYLYQQLYQFIKDDILNGRLLPNEKLPSKRKLSQHLNVSQTTIEIAYQQLQDEGFIYSKPKVGYFIEDIQTINSAPENAVVIQLPEERRQRKSIKIEDSHTGQFPFHLFRKYARDAFEKESRLLLERGDDQGEYALRNEIRRYLYHSRGVKCTNEQIIIGSSTEQLFSLLTSLLPNSSYYIENPGYPLIEKVLNQMNLSYYHVNVDKDGILVNTLGTQANIVHVSPSHQFPTGAVLSVKRRTELLKWAAEEDQRFIIEDDYDSEFRYKGRPIKALQGIDAHHKVIYMSTFSKSIFPSIRTAYMVLPQPLIQRYHQQITKPSITVPRHIQYMITKFMESGEFERNINRMRKVYKRKMEIALDALEPYHPFIQIKGAHAGMHFVVEFNKRPTFNHLDIQHHTISDYMKNPSPESFQQLIIGFGSFEDDEIAPIITQIMNILIS